MERSRLQQNLDQLTAGWRERGADAPLEILRRVWPSPLARSDQWRDLARALQALTGLAPGILTPEEHARLAEARRLVNSALRAVT